VTRQVDTVEADGVRLRVAMSGDGRPLLLVMGLGGHLDMWTAFEQRLHPYGIRTVSYDAPGTGESADYGLPRRVRGLARTSSTPGRTQMLNFFLINNTFRFVDLPGYGYAKAPRALQKDWGAAAEDYLAKREQLVLSIHIVDSRHEPSKQDLQLHDWLVHHRKPHLIVATKADKLSKNELTQSVKRAAQVLKDTNLITYSATKRQGRDRLWNAIEKSLKR